MGYMKNKNSVEIYIGVHPSWSEWNTDVDSEYDDITYDLLLAEIAKKQAKEDLKGKDWDK